jgi:hypothetical protein
MLIPSGSETRAKAALAPLLISGAEDTAINRNGSRLPRLLHERLGVAIHTGRRGPMCAATGRFKPRRILENLPLSSETRRTT